MNFRTRAFLFGLVLAVLLATSACSTPGPTPDPVEQALSKSMEAVTTGIDEGFDDSESVDLYVVQARLNPCRCEAPPHEIYAHGRWTRVFLEGGRALIAEIDETLNRHRQEFELTSLALRGAIEGEESTPQGIRYLVFEVDGVDRPSEKNTPP